MNSKSLLSIFKIGIGPSSSHTLAPMLIGNDFINYLDKFNFLQNIKGIKIDLYGSLSLTGKGHLTDVATLLGLSGFSPSNITTEKIGQTIEEIKTNKKIFLKQKKEIGFDFDNNIVFHKKFLKEHENAMMISAFDGSSNISKIYFSTGGGFFVAKEDFQDKNKIKESPIKFDFSNAKDLLDLCKEHKKGISEVVMERELQFHTKEEVNSYLLDIWQVMEDCIKEGFAAEGVLPGILKLPRRAKKLKEKLERERKEEKFNDTFSLDMLGAYALSVSEENAAGHRVVTAPTNGACGIIPAVLFYYDKFYKKLDKENIIKFLLTAATVGYLFKRNASISGAEAGCQAEVGAASAMAAAGFASLIEDDAEKILWASEIAIEHHLGMTCDPVAGLVQIPCIERNAFGATKAVLSAKMALNRDTEPFVTLDEGIKAMYLTGKDMDVKYRETSLGGLAKVIKLPIKKVKEIHPIKRVRVGIKKIKRGIKKRKNSKNKD